jgi:peptidoglycan/xylan/chitin deacetylase (PgdA/CDA1 family)
LDGETAKLLDLFERRGVKTTVFVEGRFGEERPDEVSAIVERGHELGMHGWAHEPWGALDGDAERERDLATHATEALTRASGVRPLGFRSPGGERTKETVTILKDLGYRYDAGLGDGMRPALLDAGLAQVPFVWNGVDGAHYLADPPPAPGDVERQWTAALDRVGDKGGLFLTICHGFITGAADDRLAAFDRVVAHAQDNGFELLTAREVAARVLEENS